LARSIKIIVRQGHSAIAAVTGGSYVYHIEGAGNFMRRNVRATILHRWLIHFGEEANHSAAWLYGPYLDLR
jgi:hypothetical protein